jgi:hypothetical protein
MMFIPTYYGKILERNMINLMNGFRKRVPVTFLVMTLLAPMTSHASMVINRFNTGSIFDPGGCFSQSFSRFIGSNFRNANAQLSGFDMSYRSGDHHIRRSSMRISNVFYDRTAGRISFNVNGCFHYKNTDDDFFWAADIIIVAEQL